MTNTIAHEILIILKEHIDMVEKWIDFTHSIINVSLSDMATSWFNWPHNSRSSRGRVVGFVYNLNTEFWQPYFSPLAGPSENNNSCCKEGTWFKNCKGRNYPLLPIINDTICVMATYILYVPYTTSRRLKPTQSQIVTKMLKLRFTDGHLLLNDKKVDVLLHCLTV